MQKFLLSIDNLSTKLGHFSAYSIAVLTAVICWEVGSRYFFNSPHDWVFDVTYMLYGVLFMMAGAYTLSKMVTYVATFFMVFLRQERRRF